MVGRKREQEFLNKLITSKKSEFCAVYGRRRVGKTYLIRSLFQNQFSFHITGLANAGSEQQLLNFHLTLSKLHDTPAASNWIEAFQQLIQYLEQLKSKEKKIIFIDELPWLDTPKSNFIPALEHFWNSWASARTDILLITCGSSASWMINKLINNTGGLHNRVTARLKISPFTLSECEQLLKSHQVALDRYQIVQLYMVLGGIPFYWDAVEPGKSAAQNIEHICFSENGLLRTEYEKVFHSLFKHADNHHKVVETLARKRKGLTREELLEGTGLSNAGSTTRILNELEESGFVRKYVPFEKKVRESLYQLTDFYTLFYLNFIQNTSAQDKNNWINSLDKPKHRAWSGYAFEQVCLAHSDQLKHALGISGIETTTSSWRSSGDKGAQIDLIIDRRDQVINLCEMKFSIHPFTIDKKYSEELRNKIGVFKSETKTRKAVFLTLITTFGLSPNAYSGVVQNQITMEELFV